jgi:hypothetical protein
MRFETSRIGPLRLLLLLVTLPWPSGCTGECPNGYAKEGSFCRGPAGNSSGGGGSSNDPRLGVNTTEGAVGVAGSSSGNSVGPVAKAAGLAGVGASASPSPSTSLATAAGSSGLQSVAGSTGRAPLPLCRAGYEFDCEGATLKVCAADGQGFAMLKDCDTAALCNKILGQCTTAVCEPNQAACQGNMLLTCNGDGTAFAGTKDCSPGSCDQRGAQCDRCAPGQKRCESDMVLICDAEGQNERQRAAPTTANA